MGKSLCKFILFAISLLFLQVFVSQAFGQKPVECDVKGIDKPKFKIAFISKGELLGPDIIIKPKNQTDENLIRLAKYLKQKYCQEQVIIARIFDNKNDAREFTVFGVKLIPDTLRALYSLDRDKGKEKLVRVKVIDNKEVETPIKLPK